MLTELLYLSHLTKQDCQEEVELILRSTGMEAMTERHVEGTVNS